MDTAYNEKKKKLLFAIFIASMIIVNTLGTKITTILGVRVSVGIFFMPLLFLITDIIGEVYGKKEADSFVNNAIVALIFLFLMTWICVKVPGNATWGLQKEYSQIFGSSIRMTMASLISFTVSQHLDVFTFSLFKKITQGKHLWIRNNLSTITSQFVDTTLFMFIAFYHISSKYNIGFIFSLIIPYWTFKMILALIDTPFCYLGVRLLKKDAVKVC